MKISKIEETQATQTQVKLRNFLVYYTVQIVKTDETVHIVENTAKLVDQLEYPALIKLKAELIGLYLNEDIKEILLISLELVEFNEEDYLDFIASEPNKRKGSRYFMLSFHVLSPEGNSSKNIAAIESDGTYPNENQLYQMLKEEYAKEENSIIMNVRLREFSSKKDFLSFKKV